MPEGNGEIIIPGRTDRQPPPRDRIIHGITPLPRDVLPPGTQPEETASGLTVVRKDKPSAPPLQTYTDADVPKTLDAEKPKGSSEIVPMHVWYDNVASGLLRLATETENDSARYLVTTAQELKGASVGKLNKEEHSVEEKQKLHADLDTFFATAIQDTKTLLTTEDSHKSIFANMTAVADLLRYQTKTMQIRGYQTLEALGELTDTENLITPSMLDFISRFEIPPSLAGDLLSKMDDAKLLTHPLAWHLLDTLPSDHQFKQDQRDRVQILTTLLTGDITPDILAVAKKVAQGIISVYVDPDLDNNRDKVGLEIETWPHTDAVTVPEGTTMGQDGNATTTIPELRLDNNKDVLTYGKAWRQRYYNMHLWSEVANAQGHSLHVHINKNPQTQTEVYRMLFGLDDEFSVRESVLGTVEVRGTALAGYKQIEEGAKGFASEYMPDLIDLLYSLRSLPVQPIGSDALQTDRFTFFTDVVSDPVSRAAMLLASRTEAGLRITNPQNIYKNIELNDQQTLLFASRNIKAFTPEMQEDIVMKAFFIDDESTLLSLAFHIGSLDPQLQNLYFDKIIQKKILNFTQILYTKAGTVNDRLQTLLTTRALTDDPDSGSLYCIAESFSLLKPDLQNKVLDAVFDRMSTHTFQYILLQFKSLSPAIQDRLIPYMTNPQNYNFFDGTLDKIRYLTPELQERLAKIVLDTQQKRAYYKLLPSVSSLPHDLQERLVISIIDDDNIDNLHTLIGYIDHIDPSFHESLVTAVIDINDAYMLWGLARQTPILSYPLQKQVVTKITTHPTRDVLSEVAINITKIDPSLVESVIDTVIDRKDNLALGDLLRQISSLDARFHERLVRAAFSDLKKNAIIPLMPHFGSLEPAIQKLILANIDPNSRSYKAILSNLRQWQYSLAA